MANKYCNLVGTNNIKDEYTKINMGFDKVEADIDKLETDVTAVNTRVNTIITTPISGEAATQEIVDARVSAAKSKTFASIDARFEETEQDVESHMAESVQDVGGVHGLKIESGTWTPFLSGGTHTYTEQKGLYYKIGSQVFVCGSVSLADKGVALAHLAIGGLPFAFPSANNLLALATINYSYLAIPAGDLGVIGMFASNGIFLYRLRNNASLDMFGSDNLRATTNISFSGTYLV